MDKQRRCIMLVADEEKPLLAASKLFETLGVEALVVFDCQSALALLDERRVDVAFLDMRAPGAGGLQTLVEIKKRRPLVEVVLLSEVSGLEEVVEGLKLGALDYLLRPVSSRDILSKAEEAFEKRRACEEKIRSALCGRAKSERKYVEKEAPMLGKIKVLMVDDEERFRTTTAKILDRKGFETILAESGEQALLKLSEKPQVVVLDIRMKGMSGHETLQKIKDISPETPVIMLTGHGDEESARQCLDMGASDYLSKPADSDLLYAKIREAITHGRALARPREVAVGDLMIPLRDYAVIKPSATVREAIEALREASQAFEATDRLMRTGHRSVLVMEGEEVVGVADVPEFLDAVRPAYLSDTSYRSQAAVTTWQFSRIFWTGLFTARLKEIANKSISGLMSDPPPKIAADSNLMEAADLMHEEKARRLVVVKDERIVGVLREQELFFEMVSILTRI